MSAPDRVADDLAVGKAAALLIVETGDWTPTAAIARAVEWSDADQRAWAAAYPDRACEEVERIDEPARLTVLWVDRSLRRGRRWYEAKRRALRGMAEAVRIPLHEASPTGGSRERKTVRSRSR